jgi:hypothetical protein
MGHGVDTFRGQNDQQQTAIKVGVIKVEEYVQRLQNCCFLKKDTQ